LGVTDPLMRQRIASVYTESEILRLIRLRTVSAVIKGKAPGPEASIRKALADEHGQHIMAVAKDLSGAHGMLVERNEWHYGFLFAPALTIGGGTSEVQRNIIGERVLGLPHDIDVEVGLTWSESRKRIPT
jgi:alkylation response protein AidB-like acyl-CoA dehydrogenase